jgi:glycosyltransferase involved in cell wall biosynthesis
MLRVLWVTNMFHAEGARDFRGIFVTQLRDAVVATGRVAVDVELVAQERGVLDYLGANARVRERWEEGGFDLVHVHYGLTGLATLMLSTPTPLVFTFYGSDVNVAWQRAVSVATARRAKRRIFVARRLADLWPDPRNVVLPNGVDFDVVQPADRDDSARALGLDPGPKRILFGGDPDNEVKGWPVFREVMERVRRELPGTEEIVLSEPGQPYDRVVTKLNAADVLLFTSRRGSEGSPTVVKEAAVVGLPVVTTDVGDVAETLAGVSPGGVVPWPADGSDAARSAWLDRLSDAVVAVLRAGRRSDGRSRRAGLRQETVAGRLADLYDEVAREVRGGGAG